MSECKLNLHVLGNLRKENKRNCKIMKEKERNVHWRESLHQCLYVSIKWWGTAVRSKVKK